MKKIVVGLSVMSALLLVGCSFGGGSVEEDVTSDQEGVVQSANESDALPVEEPEAAEAVESNTVTEAEILAAFQAKYPDRDYSGSTIKIDKFSRGQTNEYAFGMITSAEEGGGGWWYAVKTPGEAWLYVTGGNGDPKCSDLSQYGFPEDWYTNSCF